MPSSKSVLAIVQTPALIRQLKPFFKRRDLDLHLARDASAGILLARNVAYDLLLLELPVRKVGPLDLLMELGLPELASRQAPVLILTDDAELLDKYPGGGRFRAVSRDALPEIAVLVADFLMVEARLEKRLLVQLGVQVGGSTAFRTCQTGNISEGGMFLRTASLPPVGSELETRIELPDDRLPITATVRVVRHAQTSREARGVAVRLVHMSTSDRQRYRSFLRTELTRDQRDQPARGRRRQSPGR